MARTSPSDTVLGPVAAPTPLSPHGSRLAPLFFRRAQIAHPYGPAPLNARPRRVDHVGDPDLARRHPLWIGLPSVLADDQVRAKRHDAAVVVPDRVAEVARPVAGVAAVDRRAGGRRRLFSLELPPAADFPIDPARRLGEPTGAGASARCFKRLAPPSSRLPHIRTLPKRWRFPRPDA